MLTERFLQEDSRTEGTLCPEHMHRNPFHSILVHMAGDTENTLWQKDPPDEEYWLRPRRNKAFLNVSHEASCVLPETPCSLHIDREHNMDKRSFKYKGRHFSYSIFQSSSISHYSLWRTKCLQIQKCPCYIRNKNIKEEYLNETN